MITSIVILFVSRFFYTKKLRKEMLLYGRYTIGITKSSSLKILERFFIYYSYTYKGKVYEDYALKRKGIVSKGGRYLVYVDAKYPAFNEIDLTHTVTAIELQKIVTAPYPHHLSN